LYCDEKNRQPSQAVNTEGMGVATPSVKVVNVLWSY